MEAHKISIVLFKLRVLSMKMNLSDIKILEIFFKEKLISIGF
jgi:hypothetical protein